VQRHVVILGTMSNTELRPTECDRAAVNVTLDATKDNYGAQLKTEKDLCFQSLYPPQLNPTAYLQMIHVVYIF